LLLDNGIGYRGRPATADFQRDHGHFVTSPAPLGGPATVTSPSTGPQRAEEKLAGYLSATLARDTPTADSIRAYADIVRSVPAGS
jgi:hypothetical protein